MDGTLVCDEQLLFGQSLGAALRRQGRCDVGVVTSPSHVRPALAGGAVGTLVMSLRSDPDASLAAIRQVRRDWPRTRVVCLTDGADEEQSRAAVEAGASEVVVRTGPFDRLLAAVAVQDHQVARPPSVVSLPAPRTAAPSRDRGSHLRFLTTRERQVLALLVAARSTDAIARELGITTATARSYVQSILDKLGVHSRIEAVAHAARHTAASGPC